MPRKKVIPVHDEQSPFSAYSDNGVSIRINFPPDLYRAFSKQFNATSGGRYVADLIHRDLEAKGFTAHPEQGFIKVIQ